ncbi:MAG: hypothetical protein KGO82_14345 [Bacteroidota bacterium]|nr:hypothetical protein [Bacteroidota bacterium]
MAIEKMTTSFNFCIQGQNEKHSGSAIIVPTSLDVNNAAKQAFENDGDDRDVTVRAIGVCDGPDQPGYKATYTVYATYTDSGSDDYYYFAVMATSQEL